MSTMEQKKKKRKTKMEEISKEAVEAIDPNQSSSSPGDANSNMKTKEKKKKRKKEENTCTSTSKKREGVADGVYTKKKKRKMNEEEEGTSASNETKRSADAEKLEKKRKMNEAKGVAEKAHTEKSKPTETKRYADAPKEKRRVRFAEKVEFVQPTAEEFDEDNLWRGKRFYPEEDQMIRDAVHKYIETNQLGDDGLNMVLRCSQYPQVRKCWKDIGLSLPWRPVESVYHRAHIIFERSENRGFSREEFDLIRRFHAEHGPQWKELAKLLGKQRIHVKDAWRRIRLKEKRGCWSQDEYQNLFDLVNLDLRLKAFEEKKKNCMLRENISWEAISDKLSNPRSMATCCHKWYDQLASPLVRQGEWADTDDYYLLDALQKQDACCVEDVDWDSLLERRDGEVCRKRWNQMVRHIGSNKEMSFIDQVDVLAQRYCLDMVQYRTKVE